MIDRLREFSFSLIVGAGLVALSRALQSDFLSVFLDANLVTLLIALLAINTTTSSVVMTKLKEVSDTRAGADFSATISQLRMSLREQIGYIFAAVVLSVAAGSAPVLTSWSYADVVLASLLAGVFVAALLNLYDTAQSIFVILDFEKK